MDLSLHVTRWFALNYDVPWSPRNLDSTSLYLFLLDTLKDQILSEEE